MTDDATRLVWITFLAIMDEEGFVELSSIGNVANTARVSLEAAQAAISTLEATEPETETEEDDGRRIERVPGGWMVLNSEKYRQMATKAVKLEQNRLRVQRHRETKRNGNGPVTPSTISSPVASDPDPDSEGESRGGETPTPTDRMKEAMPKVGKLYGQPQRSWSPHEWSLLKEHIGILTDETLKMLTQFYAKERRDGNAKFLGDMRTFLRNPQSLIDRAFSAGFKPKDAPQPVIPGATSAHEPTPEPAPFPKGKALTDAVRESLQPTTKKPTNENTETRDRQPEAHNGAGD